MLMGAGKIKSFLGNGLEAGESLEICSLTSAAGRVFSTDSMNQCGFSNGLSRKEGVVPFSATFPDFLSTS
ncbi:hypothetical protein SLEP1_g58088 [Rubroshorea leprosula]|uniref:Uncharacterized protein n=1 Tax=Rubroshorea leprosula TaxID=152421 RepID=A0AAV5MNF9_9ROSI|nr:hypothetical protein SLEP1_g58088 [Rubroshorea leprosula]